MQESRVEYFDIAKGIAIISVIIGHLGISLIDRIVFTYHLPVFLFITGYFINQKKSVKEFSARKLRSLMLPYCVTCAVIILLGTVKGFLNGNVLQESTNWVIASLYGAGFTIESPFHIPQIGAIWYLPASCVGAVLLRLTLQLKKQFRPFVICLLFLIGYFSSKYLFWFPMSIQAGLCSTFFMYMGWLYRNNEQAIYHVDIERKISILIISIISWIMFIIQYTGFTIVNNNFGRGIVDIIGSVFASVLIILISKGISWKSTGIKRILLFAGRYSLIILCIHIVELDLFSWEKFIRHFASIPDQWIKLILLVLKPAILLLVTWVLLKFSIVRKLFGYNKVSPK